MRRKGFLLALANAAAAGALLAFAPALASAATSSIAFTTCAGAPNFGCGHLSVPLDPTGAIPGTVTLAIRRELSATGAATTAVVALAGGPGQAAIPFAQDDAQIVAPALTTDDLVVFDQRGTGYSGALQCSALNSLTGPISQVIPACAMQVGATRGLYTTDDTVADIEAIRVALGYTKLILYGTSYGTKVALRYAAEYPANVAGLILDSTVLPNGPDVFDQATYEAVPRILDQLCADHACLGVPHPTADLQTVLERLGDKSIKGTYIDSSGKSIRLPITADDIASLLLDGDDDPVLRADFPAAIASAATGRFALLAILVAHAVYGAIPNSTVDNPLFFDTECEELAFPWVRTDTGAARATEALAYAKGLPAGTFGPFSYLTAYQESTTADCAYWPFATAAPETTVTAFPDVPTLIISGADDLRTPTSNAEQVAAMIPDATVVVVPQTGHSVLTTEFGSCAKNAVDAYFAGTAINTDCAPQTLAPYLDPAPLAPASAQILKPVGGSGGEPGRTARALELTLAWSSRELSESLFETLIGSYNPSYSHGLGGLQGGYAKLTTNATTQNPTVRFHHFSYVPGVELTGSISNGVGRLTISGPGASGGTLVAKTSNDFAGRLGGTPIRLRISSASLTALTASATR
ncbi:MAG: alpha/beta fold hydrolase [Solirubrobacteraceae bacterium]|jgi:pimeloyl-ACP methyl ester carboxylesterase